MKNSMRLALTAILLLAVSIGGKSQTTQQDGWAGDLYWVDGVGYRLNVAEGKATVSGSSGDLAGYLYLPDALYVEKDAGGNALDPSVFNVVSVAENAFAGRDQITAVSMGSNIGSISSTAFADCLGIKEVVFRQADETDPSVLGLYARFPKNTPPIRFVGYGKEIPIPASESSYVAFPTEEITPSLGFSNRAESRGAWSGACRG